MPQDKNRDLLIYGPCAAESLTQVLVSGQEAVRRGIPIVRSSLIKPRTRPGWDGVGITTGGPWLAESANLNGIIPATEVLDGAQAAYLINEIARLCPNPLINFWIGSRNQVHSHQREIGEAVRGVSWAKVGIKNPMGRDDDHWLGAIEHVVEGGADPSQLFLIHRGYKPARWGQRNPPSLNSAKYVRERSQLPLILDPSHMGGEVNKVILLTRYFLWLHILRILEIDGLMLEIHPNPEKALTDRHQQLSWVVYDAKLAHLVDKAFPI